MSWLRALIAVAVLAVAPAGALAAPPANDTPEGAVALELGVPASVDTTEATAGRGDSGGHSVWFKVTIPGPDGIYRVDLAGSEFDTTLGFVGGLPYEGQDRSLPGGNYDVAHPAAHEAIELYLYGGGRTTLLWVDGVERSDVGTARIVVSGQASPADRFATPAPLELESGPAVSGVSRALADLELEPGEPGDPSERGSIWWRFVAPATGPIVLDTCLSEGSGSTGDVLRVLTGEPLSQATVLVTGAGDPFGCPRVELAVTAGTAYRVQSTMTTFLNSGVVTLRARAAGTPPAITLGTPSCTEQSCDLDVEALPAPGTTLGAVECRVGTGVWEPCTPTARDGHWSLRFQSPQPSGELRLAARAGDSSGRQSLTKTRFFTAQPAAGPLPGAPPPSDTREPSGKRRPARLPAPSARFELTRRGTRVRALTLRGLPRGAAVVVRCHGARCPFTSRTRKQRRSGAMRLTRLFAGRMLTAGTRIRVTVSARNRSTRTTRWRIRADRLPRRT